MSELCSIGDVKGWIDKKETDNLDPLLQMIIEGVSDRMILAMPRFSIAHTVTSEAQEFMGYPWLTVLEPPIVSAANLTTVVEGTATLTPDQYRLDGDDTVVRTTSDGLETTWSHRQIFLTYISGYAENAIPADLRLGAVAQCAHEWRLAKPGGDRLGVDGSSPKEGDAITYRREGWVEPALLAMRAYGANIHEVTGRAGR